jgi:hypothetical protein
MLIKNVEVLHAQAPPNVAGVGIICRLISIVQAPPIVAGVGITRRFPFAFSLTKFIAIFAEMKVNFGIRILINQLGCSFESSVKKLEIR